jgi:multiple sugar transport system permease protein
VGAAIQRNQGLMFALPALAVMATLILYPLAYTGWLSVTTDRGGFVGAENYRTMIDDSVTTMALRNTAVYVGFSVALQVLLGAAVGILLNRRFRGRALVRSIVLIPWVVPAIVTATNWGWMLHTEFGIVNYMLTELGVIGAPVGWLTTRTTVLPALVAVNVWRMAPFVAVMVLAGLQAIPEAVYEAARIDGAAFRHEVRYVMLPHLRPVLLAVTLLLMIWGFNGITIIYAMTRGGPANRSLITPIQIFKHAFEFVRFNEAAALSVMLFAFLAVLTGVYLRVSRQREER